MSAVSRGFLIKAHLFQPVLFIADFYIIKNIQSATHMHLSTYLLSDIKKFF